MQTSASCGPGSEGRRAGNPPSARHHHETSPLRMGRRYRSAVSRKDFRVAFLIMRLGVLDVGSNTVHLLVVDAYPGARPLPAFSHKVDMRLAAHLLPDNTLSKDGEALLAEFVLEAMRIAEDKGVEEFLAFATSAVRDAGNGLDVLARVQARTRTQIRALSGENEARLTFLAARRWFGWSSGRLLVFDIGGGSLEVAAGQDEEPEAAMSLPLGAGRLTRDCFTADPPSPEEVRALRKHVRA